MVADIVLALLVICVCVTLSSLLPDSRDMMTELLSDMFETKLNSALKPKLFAVAPSPATCNTGLVIGRLKLIVIVPTL